MINRWTNSRRLSPINYRKSYLSAEVYLIHVLYFLGSFGCYINEEFCENFCIEKSFDV